MIKYKVPFMVAGAAFALAFIVGLISGIRFSFILFRSFVLAVVSGGFTVGARFLLEKFTPDIFQLLPETGGAKTEVTGKNLNISIDDPIDMENAPEVKEFKQEDEVPFKNYDGEQVVSASGDKTDNNMEEDLQDEAFEADIADDVSGLNMDNAEDTKDSIGAAADFKQEDKGSGDIDALEELPDLQGFAPADEELIEDESGKDFMEKESGNFNTPSGLSDVDSDTKTMVQAIQTILKREP